MSDKVFKILLTGVGCPGALTVIKALWRNSEGGIYLIGTDMRATASGRWFVDEFYQVPAGDDPGFIGAMLGIAQQVKPDIIFPQLTNEVRAWALHKDEFDYPVLIDRPWIVEICQDKQLTYQALRETSVPIPAHTLCQSPLDFADACTGLGWPDKPVCFKPTAGKGMRGFHVIAARGEDRATALLEGRPGSMRLSFDEVFDLLIYDDFPPLLVMEYIEGQEACVDVFCDKGEVLMGFAKTRETFRAGLAYEFRTIDDSKLWEYALEIVSRLGMSYFANIQFRGDYLMEINPRISTMMLHPHFNMPWLAVKYMLGEATADYLRLACIRNRGEVTTSIRYHDQLFLGGDDGVIWK